MVVIVIGIPINLEINNLKTLAEYLHENNFYTQADVHSDLIMPQNGFDEYTVFDELKVNLTVRHKQLLENMKKKKKFFLYYTIVQCTPT